MQAQIIELQHRITQLSNNRDTKQENLRKFL